jgi:hypothetical protein
MAQSDVANLTMHLKLAYLGAPGAGKEANLAALAAGGRPTAGLPVQTLGPTRGRERVQVMRVRLPAEAMPLSLVQRRWSGWTVVYAADPDDVEAMTTCLEDCDAIVYIAHSDWDELGRTLNGFAMMVGVVEAHGEDFGRHPLVVQYNHRDAASAMPPDVMRSALTDVINAWPACWPSDAEAFSAVEAIASGGRGVRETLARAVRAALDGPRLRDEVASLVGGYADA